MGYEVRGVRDGACGAYVFAEPLPPTMSFAEMLAATRRAANSTGCARFSNLTWTGEPVGRGRIRPRTRGRPRRGVRMGKTPPNPPDKH